ncbi:MAG: hypothetical protein RTU63_09625 [Candidatus Thorarchaeota archaeon]
MANNTNTTPSFATRPVFVQRDYAWMIATFILTPITAMALAISGYISISPMTAAIDGLLVSFMYVGFRVVNALRLRRLYMRKFAQKQNIESVPE